MILVVDANILFAALIKNSLTAELMFNSDFQLYTCEFIIDEFFKYEKEIIKKTHRTREEFITVMHQLKDIITIIPKEEYSKQMIEAANFSPDPKDTMYFALAMKLNASIWSNDDRLKEQDKVIIYKTSDLMKLV